MISTRFVVRVMGIALLVQRIESGANRGAVAGVELLQR